MRHLRDHRKLSRTKAHRKALLRNLVTALFLHERIETTLIKAKEARRLAERLITYAKRNNLHSRRLVAAVVNDREVVKKIFDAIAPLYATRQGGYTRVLRTRRRLGDAGEMAILELVKSKEQKDAERKRKTEAEEALKPKKKSFLGWRKKKEEPAAEAAAVPVAATPEPKPKAAKKAVKKTEAKPEKKAEAGAKTEKKPVKKAVKKTATTTAKKTAKATEAATKARKPRTKAAEGPPATKPKGPKAGGGAAVQRKSRGSQRGK